MTRRRRAPFTSGGSGGSNINSAKDKEIESLKQVIRELRQQLYFSQLRPNQQTDEEVATTDDYETDEAEFDSTARGAAWMTATTSRPAKKRKALGSPKPITQTNPTPKAEVQQVRREPVPPPIFVRGKSIQDLINFIKSNQMKATTKTMRAVDNIKINPANEDEYRKISAWLSEINAEWHSFANKHTRPLRVMARGLNKDTKVEDIATDLKAQGFKIANTNAATNIRNSSTKQALNLFMLSFQCDQDPNAVFKIKYIDRQVVKIEEIKNKSNKIVQCKRCQDYNHTQAFCHRNIACVKCGESHLTKDCTKARDVPAKCINCHGDHPANYRGCSYAVSLQAAKKKANPKYKKLVQFRQPNVSYADKARLGATNPSSPAADDTTLGILKAFIAEQKKFNQMVSQRLALIHDYSV